MDYFGINTPEDLPKIKEVLAEQIVTPTMINHTDFEQSETLAISDDGELIQAVDEKELGEEEHHVNGHSIPEMEVGQEEDDEMPAYEDTGYEVRDSDDAEQENNENATTDKNQDTDEESKNETGEIPEGE